MAINQLRKKDKKNQNQNLTQSWPTDVTFSNTHVNVRMFPLRKNKKTDDSKT